MSELLCGIVANCSSFRLRDAVIRDAVIRDAVIRIAQRTEMTFDFLRDFWGLFIRIGTVVPQFQTENHNVIEPRNNAYLNHNAPLSEQSYKHLILKCHNSNTCTVIREHPGPPPKKTPTPIPTPTGQLVPFSI